MRITQLDERGHLWRAAGPVGELDEVDRHERARPVAELEGSAELGDTSQQDGVWWMAKGNVGERSARTTHERANDLVAGEWSDWDGETIAVARQVHRADWHAVVCDDVVRDPSLVIAADA